MKITHVCLTGPFSDGWSYQENLLSKYHKKLGYDVDVIASQYVWGSDGKIGMHSKEDYINDDGVHMIRIPSTMHTNINSKVRLYKGLYSAIEKSAPDILFIHGVQFVGIGTIVNYLKKHNDTVVYVDNHSDFSNSASSWISKNVQHKILWKYFAKKINPYVKKFYGVLPARVDFLVDMYDLPKEKVELLVMGADDELVESAANSKKKEEIRAKYNIGNDDFLIMTGGKIDLHKQQTLLLMDAVNEINNPKVKLLVFGSVVDELMEEVNKRCSDKAQYIGWVVSKDSYQYFAAADLVVFPGRHSVFWEQVVGQGIPMIVKYWDGTTHVDVCGNVKFLRNDSSEEIKDTINSVIANYAELKNKAVNAQKKFVYSDIAKKSISN